ncbi:hypothetical protein BD779DRAFT_1499735 [Infundibulicybe gibba]|nr:hypothetical protein BD779DRAFT_1499735 [Infundibulicybe gibba]
MSSSRLVENIRLGDGPSGDNGVLAKDWDINIEDHEAEFRDDLRAASGIGRKRQKRGRTGGPILSQQVRSLIGDGNQAYVDNNLHEAMRVMQEVIRIEPRAASAWSVLAQCYEDMKENQRALQLRIMAAHLTHDADEWDHLARQSRVQGYNQQALYCYRKVSSLDPSNVDAMWDRAALAKEMGDLRTARNAFLTILKRFPHDLTVLGELRPILIDLSDLRTCAGLFQQAFDHHQKVFASGRVLVLADLYNTLGEHEHAIDVIRKGTRWLQGRGDQIYWDRCEDDREYDLLDGKPRPEASQDGQIEPGRYPLNVNSRHRLAVARIKMGQIEEGTLHANIVLSEEVLDYAPLFLEIADALFEREHYTEAKPIYEVLGTDAATSSVYVLLQTAACLRMLDELREAAEVYEHVRIADPGHNDAKMKLAEIYEILNEPRKALELVYEVIDSRKKKPKENQEVAIGDSNPSTSLFAEEKTTKQKTPGVRASNRLTRAQLRELEARKESEVIKGYRRLKDLWPRMLAGSQENQPAEGEWLLEAEKLVETYRETRNLFVTSRAHPFRGMFPNRKRVRNENETEEDRMASRLHLDLDHDLLAKKKSKEGSTQEVDVFRGVSFDDWLRLFMQYCFLLTRRGQYEQADEILRHIMLSNPYQTRERQDSIRIALITCAISVRRHSIVVEQVRKLITAHQFNNEPQRILLAALSSGMRPTDAFISSTLQKHLFRELKLTDHAVKNPEAMKWNALNKRFVSTTQAKGGEAYDGPEDDAEDDAQVADEATIVNNKVHPEIPTKSNPLMVAVYGQICIAAKSYQSAIFYLLHAYDYCPDDPMICLCLAIASIGRAMQRQSDNRHHLVAQALACLSRYRLLRANETYGMEEVDYNFGRAFHQLGLYSHAVRHYERTLELAGNNNTQTLTFAREAAYNLSLIYVSTGAMPLAQELYRKWLSI